MLIPRFPTPEIILPDGLRAQRALREFRRRERDKLRRIRDPRLEPYLRRRCAITVTQAVAAVAGSNLTTITVSFSSTAAGATLIACIGRSVASSIDIVSVVDSSTATWTAGPGAADATNGADIYYRENAGAGVTSVVVTFDTAASVNNGQVSVYELAGTATSSVLGQTSTLTGSQTGTTINLSVTSFTPDQTTSIIIGVGRISVTPTTNFAAGADYTLGGTTNRMASEYKIRAGAGNETAPLDAVFAASGTRSWAMAAAEFKAPAAGDVFGWWPHSPQPHFPREIVGY